VLAVTVLAVTVLAVTVLAAKGAGGGNEPVSTPHHFADQAGLPPMR